MGDSPGNLGTPPGGEPGAKRRIVSAGRGRGRGGRGGKLATIPRASGGGEGTPRGFAAEVRPADGAAKELFHAPGEDEGAGNLQGVMDEIEAEVERLGIPDSDRKKKLLPKGVVALLPNLVMAARREHPEYAGQVCSNKAFMDELMRILGLHTSPEVLRRKLRALDTAQEEAAQEAALAGALDRLNARVAEELTGLDSQAAAGSSDEDFQGTAGAGAVKWDREMEDLMGQIHTCCMEKPNPIKEVRQVYEKITEWFPSGTIDTKALQKYARKSKMRQNAAKIRQQS